MNAPAFADDMQLLNGNHAVAWGVRLAGPDVAPLYPITPQTPILEKLIEFQSSGAFQAELLTPESEHSAMAAAIAASATGARVFTATSSQGLLLMHELLHFASGARTPIVMFNVNRTPASPWGFWPDQIDSLSQRDTGWVQLYSENPQDSLDSVIQAFRIAEATNLPVMINHDAFYVSHSVEPVSLPSPEAVTDFLPRQARDIQLGDGSGRSLGAPIDQASWNRTRRDLDEAMKTVEQFAIDASQVWEKQTGRASAPLEFYRYHDAEIVFVTMGSMCGTAREAIDRLRTSGIKAGLLKVRLFRPLPNEALRDALRGAQHAIVLDRNYSPGTGGVLHQELRSVLFGTQDPPRLHGYLAGVGGLSVPEERLEALATEVRDTVPAANSLWLE
ncbi:MAG: pyruvate ferredoxin oxidoreductase [Halieaceae bacterium]|nr:pyruvate ferredoxin oxidoreductase [Halieaceae bacterium]MCP4767114.1 pyruvate ferredoxin oxidoreductase [Gammaproteobacteria bacterium]